jgi:uncharacterized integral membrane protein
MTIQNGEFPVDSGQPVPTPSQQPVPDAAARQVPDGSAQVVPGDTQQVAPGGVPAPGPDAGTVPPRQHVIRRTRVGGVWVTLAISAIVLILLLVFILENLKRADVSMFGAHADLPLGVALLLSAAAGALIVIIPGTGRIVQLRRTARRHRHQDTQPGGASVPAGR